MRERDEKLKCQEEKSVLIKPSDQVIEVNEASFGSCSPQELHQLASIFSLPLPILPCNSLFRKINHR